MISSHDGTEARLPRAELLRRLRFGCVGCVDGVLAAGAREPPLAAAATCSAAASLAGAAFSVSTRSGSALSGPAPAAGCAGPGLLGSFSAGGGAGPFRARPG